MVVLGLTYPLSGIHDNSCALVKNGKLLYAASEERFTRIKHDGAFPSLAIDEGLKTCGLAYADIDAIGVGFSDYHIFTMIAREKRQFAALAMRLLLSAPIETLIRIPFLVGTLALPRIYKSNTIADLPRVPVTHVEHHLSHAASAYYTQPHPSALCLVFDGYGPDAVGNWLSGAVFQANNGVLTEVLRVPVEASLGLFYQKLTVALGFAPNDGEGKTMGLAAYGTHTGAHEELLAVAPHWTGKRFRPMAAWREMMLAGRTYSRALYLATPSGRLLTDLINRYGPENVAWAGQKILEDEMVAFVSSIVSKPTHLVCAGGVFLNVKMSQRIRELPLVKSLYVHPNAADGGTAVGAALVVAKGLTPQSRLGVKPLKSADLGVGFIDAQIQEVLISHRTVISYRRVANLPRYVALRLTKGIVIGWFQGRAEWGPRALGYRSVLADPRKIEIKNRINSLLKQREWFMPFAPSVLEEEAPRWFKGCKRSPFMTMLYDVFPRKAKLIPAAIHIDNTARPNTVNQQDNPLYYQVIREFGKLTGIPVILNTSFNKHGLPIVNTPQDAIEHLLMGCVDELAIGSYIVKRK